MLLNQWTLKGSSNAKAILWTRMLRTFLVLSLIGIAAAGCGNRYELEQERKLLEAQNVKPENYKPDLLAFLRTYLNDPAGVHDAGLSEPQKLNVQEVERYAACLRYNARNSTDRYTGLSNHLAVFISGKFDRLIELGRVSREATGGALQPLRDYCATATYRPFPELEQLRR
jgi:hypothetical protein